MQVQLDCDWHIAVKKINMYLTKCIMYCGSLQTLSVFDIEGLAKRHCRPMLFIDDLFAGGGNWEKLKRWIARRDKIKRRRAVNPQYKNKSPKNIRDILCTRGKFLLGYQLNVTVFVSEVE